MADQVIGAVARQTRLLVIDLIAAIHPIQFVGRSREPDEAGAEFAQALLQLFLRVASRVHGDVDEIDALRAIAELVLDSLPQRERDRTGLRAKRVAERQYDDASAP